MKGRIPQMANLPNSKSHGEASPHGEGEGIGEEHIGMTNPGRRRDATGLRSSSRLPRSARWGGRGERSVIDQRLRYAHVLRARAALGIRKPRPGLHRGDRVAVRARLSYGVAYGDGRLQGPADEVPRVLRHEDGSQECRHSSTYVQDCLAHGLRGV